MLRIGDDFLRVAGFDHYPAVHEDKPVTDLACETHLVGHDDHGHTLSGQRSHYVKHLSDQFGIQGAGRLVEEHQLWIHREGPGNGDALLLATGKLRRIHRGPIGKANSFEQGKGTLAGIVALNSLDEHRCFHDVFYGRLVRE